MLKSFRTPSDEHNFIDLTLFLLVRAQTEVSELLTERQPRDAKKACGLELIAVCEPNGLSDDLFLSSFLQARMRILQLTALGRGEQTAGEIPQRLVRRVGLASGPVRCGAHVVRIDGITACEQQDLTGDIFQLAHVPEPRLRLEKLHRVWMNRGVGDAQRDAVFSEEIVDQFRNVLAPITEGRQVDDHDTKPVIEVFAKLFFSNGVIEIPMSCGDDADVHGNALLAAEPLQAVFLKNAHEFHLRTGCHVTDFVEKDGSITGLLKPADAARFRSGECAQLIADEVSVSMLSRAGLQFAFVHE